jgi:hypothetical protein
MLTCNSGVSRTNSAGAFPRSRFLFALSVYFRKLRILFLRAASASPPKVGGAALIVGLPHGSPVALENLVDAGFGEVTWANRVLFDVPENVASEDGHATGTESSRR